MVVKTNWSSFELTFLLSSPLKLLIYSIILLFQTLRWMWIFKRKYYFQRQLCAFSVQCISIQQFNLTILRELLTIGQCANSAKGFRDMHSFYTFELENWRWGWEFSAVNYVTTTITDDVLVFYINSS